MIKCNMDITFARKETVKQYIEKDVLSNRFLCKYYDACKSSCKVNFYEGQLHHIGNHYDLIYNSKPYRIIIVGQEYGTKDVNVSLQKRYEDIMYAALQKRFFSENNFIARNPHMKGTTSLLKALFGLSNEPDYENEFIVINGTKHHIFDSFALVNYLLCSAVSSEEGKKGKSTNEMKKNCRIHFRNIIEILEPTIIVVQGEGFFDWIIQSFDSSRNISENIYNAKIGSLESFLLRFSHPAAQFPKNWGVNASTPYLLETVIPSVREVKKLMGISYIL